MGAVGILLHYMVLSNWYRFLFSSILVQKIVLQGSFSSCLEIICCKFYLMTLISQSTQCLAIEPDVPMPAIVLGMQHAFALCNEFAARFWDAMMHQFGLV